MDFLEIDKDSLDAKGIRIHGAATGHFSAVRLVAIRDRDTYNRVVLDKYAAVMVELLLSRSVDSPCEVKKEPDMNLDELKKRFVEEVKLRAYEDRYIDKKEEREILQVAIQNGVGVDAARSALTQVCATNEYVLESQVVGQAREMLETFSSNDGQIEEKEFNDVLLSMKRWTKGKRNDTHLKRMLVDLIDDNTLRTTRGIFNDWYTRVRKEVGK
jgi:hypothetical protein